MLPFGLRSAPKIFTAVADALEWCVHRRGVEFLFHYLDDFLVMDPAASDICKRSLELLVEECSNLGVPLSPEKTEGPSSVLTFLGIEINTIEGILGLPAEKLQRLNTTVREWLPRKSCTRRELESLVGTLQHACKVIRPGRSFLRRAVALISRAKKPFHYIRLNQLAVVEDFCITLEWSSTYHRSKLASASCSHIRCVRLLGVWSMV